MHRSIQNCFFLQISLLMPNPWQITIPSSHRMWLSADSAKRIGIVVASFHETSVPHCFNSLIRTPWRYIKTIKSKKTSAAYGDKTSIQVWLQLQHIDWDCCIESQQRRCTSTNHIFWKVTNTTQCHLWSLSNSCPCTLLVFLSSLTSILHYKRNIRQQEDKFGWLAVCW